MPSKYPWAPGRRCPGPGCQGVFLKGSATGASCPAVQPRSLESFLGQEACGCCQSGREWSQTPRRRERSPWAGGGFPWTTIRTVWTKVSGSEDDKWVEAPAQDPEGGLPRETSLTPAHPSCLDTSAQCSLKCRVHACVVHPGRRPKQNPMAGSEAQSGSPALENPEPPGASVQAECGCTAAPLPVGGSPVPGDLGTRPTPGLTRCAGSAVPPWAVTASLGQMTCSLGCAWCSGASTRQLGQRQCFSGQSYTLTYPVLV